MSSNINAGAAFAIQSHWLHDNCQNAPQLIIGTTDIYSTIPFTDLVYSGFGYCGWEWIEDCSNPGICSASLNLEMTDGIQSFQDSYLYSIPASPAEWLFPLGAKGSSYCVVKSVNQSTLLLAGSNYCYASFECTRDSGLQIYESADCTGPFNLFSNLSIDTQSITIGANEFNISTFTVTKATEGVVWTTFISDGTLLPPFQKLWAISLFLVIFTALLLLAHLGLSIFYFIANKKPKFLIFTFGLSIAIAECVLTFFTFTAFSIPSYTVNFTYGLSSIINVFLNCQCMSELVFRKKIHQLILFALVSLITIAFGLPFVLYVGYYTDEVTVVGIWINWYFNSICYPVWQIFCFAFDPLTAGIVVFYIIRTCLMEFKQDKWTLLKLMFNDYKLVILCIISLTNFVTAVFLQIATTYTFYAQNDQVMLVYDSLFTLQHAVNACCTLWYYMYFPVVFINFKLVKKSLHKKSKADASSKNISKTKNK
ncbi:hypothetical protein HDV06_006584 [Boothiomyces sp. JEL0866]|nr:hypothetical protein HDV06_006584 [Boothiomyces sp. JEL0866]